MSQKLNVPHVSQSSRVDCAQACVAMVYAFYGIPFDPESVAAGLSTDDHDGTDNDDLGKLLQEAFICGPFIQGTIAQIKQSIDAGNPVLVNFLVPYDHGEMQNPDSARCVNKTNIPADIDYRYYDGHYALVVGYDDDQDILYIHNPEHEGYETISTTHFEKVWMSYYVNHVKWMLLVEHVRDRMSSRAAAALSN